LKFSDMIMVAALLFVAGLLLDSFLFVPFVPLKSSGGWVASAIAVLIISIIVGYLFAAKIKEESTLRAIGSIVLLATVGFMIFLVGWNANPLASPAIKDGIQSIFKTAGWTDYDWYAYTALVQALEILFFVVVNFVGLYVGSMLNRKRM